jgi:hypothetical protein
LAGGLRRAGDAGSIREISTGRYADAARTSLGGHVGDLSVGDYDSAVRRYQEHFARDVGHMTSSFPIRVFTLLFETVFRVTGGRFGLEPGIVDLDGVSLSFSLDVALEPLGWACESAHRLEGVRIIDVRPVDGAAAADRKSVVTAIQRVVTGSHRFAGRHRVVFPGGDQVDLS